MSNLRPCRFCRNKFSPIRKNNKYCSEACSKDHAEKSGIHCKVCTQKFIPIRKSQEFCCVKCWGESRKALKFNIPTPLPVAGATWIPLSQGKFALIEDADVPFVSKFNWVVVKVRPNRFGGVFYAKCSETDKYMHVMLTNPPEGLEVDHMNGDGLDNRRSLLRIVTRSQNQANSFSKPSQSIYKGISKVKGYQDKWVAHISANNVSYHLGYHTGEILAAEAFDAAARLHFGLNARLNFPKLGEFSAIKRVSP